ncbi:MAG TPA: hypothetical protein VM890_14030 [Longimicrobium sp.]|jgi:hypothetical protein|nr:hypothetical protein [Longimicrobium sp.]
MIISRIVVLAAVLGGLGACSRPDAGRAPEEDRPLVDLARFDATFDSLGTIVLEERGNALSVAPIVQPEPGGGFLVVDQKEAQGRIYDPRGRLLHTFGRAGEGPGEFTAPISARRTPSGKLLVADAMGERLTLLDSVGQRVVGTWSIPILPIYGALPLSESRVLVLGRNPEANARTRLLHVWDLAGKQAIQSFFPAPGPDEIQEVAASIAWAGALSRDGSLAAIFSLSDTVYEFDPAGRLARRVRIPFRAFGRFSLPSDAARADPVARMRWMEKVVRVFDIHPRPDGGYLVQYLHTRGNEREWGLVAMTRDGRRTFDLARTPRLLAVRGDTLYFVDPRGEVPNRWRIARIRAAR